MRSCRGIIPSYVSTAALGECIASGSWFSCAKSPENSLNWVSRSLRSAAIPGAIGDVPELNLNAGFNKISAVPDDICNISRIDLTGNPIGEREAARIRGLWQEKGKDPRFLRF